MNYEKDIRIDETALDIEWLEQPSLMIKYARIAAHCRMVLDQKKEALDLVKAHLDQEIRSNPSEFGIEKITEQVMLNTIIDQVPYKEAFAEYLEAKFEADVAQGAVRAFDARKDALENLVRLNGQQYFAGPKMPRNLTQERERKQEEVTQLNASIARKIRRTI